MMFVLKIENADDNYYYYCYYYSRLKIFKRRRFPLMEWKKVDHFFSYISSSFFSLRGREYNQEGRMKKNNVELIKIVLTLNKTVILKKKNSEDKDSFL